MEGLRESQRAQDEQSPDGMVDLPTLMITSQVDRFLQVRVFICVWVHVEWEQAVRWCEVPFSTRLYDPTLGRPTHAIPHRSIQARIGISTLIRHYLDINKAPGQEPFIPPTDPIVPSAASYSSE